MENIEKYNWWPNTTLADGLSPSGSVEFRNTQLVGGDGFIRVRFSSRVGSPNTYGNIL